MQIHIHATEVHLALPAPDHIEIRQEAFGRVWPPFSTFSGSQPPALGEFWPGQGGLYCGSMPPRGDKAGYHLVVAGMKAASITFGPSTEVDGAGDHYDGLANTLALVKAGKHPAAEWASSVEADGHKDFYLPSHAELCMAWICAPQLFDTEGWHWSSTQSSRYYAWVQDFERGHSNFYDKVNEFRARAVRRVPL